MSGTIGFAGATTLVGAVGAVVVLWAAQTLADGQRPLPELQYTEPAGFFRSGIYPPADFSAPSMDASLQVYPFRIVNGDPRPVFAQTLLREMVDPRFRETNVAPGGRVDQVSIPGADLVLRAQFREIQYGRAREHMRMAVIAGNAVAIVDASASSPENWRNVVPTLNVFASTLRVTTAPTAPAGPPPSTATRSVAGLYMGLKNRFISGILGMPGTSRMVLASHYILLSAEGRVYRAYDELPVPGNNPSRFDFGGAQRQDPDNSGTYVVQGDLIVMRFGNPASPEIVRARMASRNTIVIGDLEYERQ